MKPLPPVSAAERQFIESVGVSAGFLGLPRIAGRVLGLLLLAPRPLALDEIAALLRISKASASVNTRLLIASGVLRLTAFDDDRRRFYTLEPQMFERRMESLDRYLDSMRRLTVEGLAAVSPDNHPARERLLAADRFATFMGAQLRELAPRLALFLASESPSSVPATPSPGAS